MTALTGAIAEEIFAKDLITDLCMGISNAGNAGTNQLVPGRLPQEKITAIGAVTLKIATVTK